MSSVETEIQPVKVDDGTRLLNVGVAVTLKKLGNVQVKELTLENIILLSKDILKILTSMSETTSGSKDGISWVLFLLENPDTVEAVKKVAAASSGVGADHFTNMGISDWLKLITAFKQVTDWEEIKELFFQLLPMEMNFPSLLSQKT